MKQTEIGMIPDDWEVKELGTLARFQQGYQIFFADQTNYSIDGYIRYLYISDFFSNQNILYVKDSNNYYHITEKDICIANTGATCGKAFRGKIGLLSNNMFKVFLSQKLDCDYTWQYFNSLLYSKELSEHINGAGQPHVGHKNMALIKIPLPPTLAEQQKIAKALSDVDNVISTLGKLITKKKNLKQGTMQQLLTGKKRLPGFAPTVVEPVETTKFKQTEIGEIPEDWEVVNIQDILITTKDKLKIGPFGSQLKKEYLLENGQYKVFGQENVYLNDFEYCYRFLTKEHFQNLQSCELKEGDFVISTMGTIGKCAIVPKKAGVGIMDSHLVRLRLNQNIDKEYFKYYFQSDIIQNQIAALSVGGIMDGLSTSIIKKLKVIKFSISEQTAIANVLSSMDKEIEALNTKLEKYRNLKTGMMQQLLTGKIRLV